MYRDVHQLRTKSIDCCGKVVGAKQFLQMRTQLVQITTRDACQQLKMRHRRNGPASGIVRGAERAPQQGGSVENPGTILAGIPTVRRIG